MRLYQINKGKLSKIKEEPFKLEKDLLNKRRQEFKENVNSGNK